MKKDSYETTHHIAEVHQEHEPNVLSGDVKMVGLTWLTFILLLAVLYKFAWKPILTLLDEREKNIKESVEEAERIKNELEDINNKRETLIKEAQDESKRLIDKARKGAAEAAKTIEHKAREEGKIILENAKREITEEKEKAQAELKEESIKIAVDLAGKLIEENLDNDKNKKIINRFIKKI